jgi:hypothetical protein
LVAAPPAAVKALALCSAAHKMAFLGGAGAALKGFTNAQQTAYQNALQDRYAKMQQQQNEAQAARDAAEQAYRDAESKRLEQQQTAQNHALGLDADGKPLPPPVLPPALSQVIPNQKSFKPGTIPKVGSPEYAAYRAEQLRSLAIWAANNGRPDLAKTYSDQATGASYDAQRIGSAAVSRAKVPEIYSQRDYNEARAAAEKDLPARAREIAKGHDQASLDRAAQQVNSREWIAKLNDGTRRDLAQYNAQARFAIAQLAGAYHLTGVDEQTATQRAIADYKGGVQRYLQSVRPYSGLDVVPGGDGTQMPAGVASPGGGTTVNVNMPPFPGAVPNNGGLQPPGANAGGGGGAGPTAQNAAKVLADARAAMGQGASPHAIRARLNEMMQRNEITGYQRDQIVRQLGIMQQATPVAPPPVKTPGGIAPLVPGSPVIPPPRQTSQVGGPASPFPVG